MVLRIFVLFLGLLIFAMPAEAYMGQKKGKSGKGKTRDARAPYEYFEERGLFATGLQAVFPTGVTCEGVASPYGSQTRYDGSRRNNDHHNYHNGLDISLKIGTPLLAMADATIVHAGTAGQLVGHYVWLQYAPNDTDLPDYVYMRYQHLDQPTDRQIGSRVSKGQVVGLSGRSGTMGGHFGKAGYPHLHMNILISQSERYSIKGPQLGPKFMHYFDPLGLFVTPVLDHLNNYLLKDLVNKQVNIAVQTPQGIVPPDARLIWPVACR
ncbi:M23 family metallopeptidase [Terasakiella sp.]|uniref:M23 family metallopeptidase n=1 Tax=Terasakiella sp. TaxID=2034861 RepID=UPI003AA884C5